MSSLALMLTLILGFPQQQTEDLDPLPWTPVAVIDDDPVVRGMPRDGIPAIDEPRFLTGRRAAETMQDDEMVIGIEINGEARAYSIWQLNTHEVVNDRIGDLPIVVTWCPLCFTGIVYDRRVGGREVTFGIEGVLWRENQVLYDRQTESWWSQAAGRAIRGDCEGQELIQVASVMTTWAEWVVDHPDTLLLSKYTPEGLEGYYDMYAAYHANTNLGVTGLRRAVGSRDPKLRVAGFRVDGRAFTIGLDALPAHALLVADVDGVSFVVSGDGATGVRVFRAGSHALVAAEEGPVGTLVDRKTGSLWDGRRGVATDGPLAGTALDEIAVTPSYWFAWQAFFPQTIWIDPAR